MKKKVVFTGSAVIGGLALLWGSMLVDETEVEETVQSSTYSEGAPPLLKKTEKTPLNVNPTEQRPAPLTLLKKDLKFDDDWCIRRELDDDGAELARLKSEEWALSSGNLNFSGKKDSRSPNYSNNDAVVESYVAMDNTSLLEAAKSNDEIAKLALLERDGISNKLKRLLALDLLALGKTGIALRHLLIDELVGVENVLENGDKPTNDQKVKLVNILSYINYGIERLDISGLNLLLSGLKMANNEKALLSILTPKYIELADMRLQKLKKIIDAKRIKNGLPPISAVSPPKIAKHEFESQLAIMSDDLREALTNFQRLNTTHGALLDEGGCVEKIQTTFFPHAKK